MLFTGGYEFLDPPPQPTADGIIPSPSDAPASSTRGPRSSTPTPASPPAMCMLLPGMGSQYLMAMRDSGGEYLDGARGQGSNWIQTVPGKGFFTILRLYNPLPPFFDKSWQPSEIEPT